MGLKSVTGALGGLIIVACFVFIYLLNFTDKFDDSIHGNKKIILSAILFAYAVFRAYRLVALMKKKN